MSGPFGTGDIFDAFILLEEWLPEEEVEDDGVEAPLFPADLGETLAELRPAAAAVGAAPPDLTEVTEPDLSRGDKLELRLDDRELAGLDLALPVVDDFEDALTGLNVDCGGGRAFASVALEGGEGWTHAATADSAMVTVILAPLPLPTPTEEEEEGGFCLGSLGTELGLEGGSLGLEDFKVVGCWRELKLSRPWGK